MKPSVVQRKSYDSVTVFWVDHDSLVDRLGKAAAELRRERPEVRGVRLFGSVARHRETAASDADVLPFLGRCEPYTPYFDGVGFPVEIFVYNTAETSPNPPPVLRTAMSTGRVLA